MRALRAQISPHFIYNSLGAIASFVRTDPDRARELLLEFADFTRYSFRRHGEFTTLAEELRSIERYLLLEQARFGDRLQVTLEHRARGAAGRRAVPVRPAAGRERRAPRPRGRRRRRPDHDHRPRPRPGVRDRGRGRRRRRGPRAGTPRAGRRRRASTRSGSATSTPGCATPTATSTAWSSRPRPGAGTKVIVRVPKFAPGVQRVSGLRVLVVDDERPALDELAYLLGPRPAGRRGAHLRLRDRRPCGPCARPRSTRCSSTSRCPG